MTSLHIGIAGAGLAGRTLATLLACCHGDDRPDCPILDDLAGTAQR